VAGCVAGADCICAAAAFDYVGYVEGRDVFRGDVDVVVTDGFTGNVVLKSVEGAAEVIMSMVREEIERAGPLARLGAAFMLKPLRRLKRRTDYAEYGGAPLVGVNGVALICHGGSNARADKVALPDTHNTLSTFSAPRQVRPQPLSVILSDATIGLSQSLPDFPRLVTPAATISRRSFTERSHNRCFLKDRGKSNIPSN